MNELFMIIPCFICYILFILLILTWQQISFLKKDVRKAEKDISNLTYRK
jgi:hypothetical protein